MLPCMKIGDLSVTRLMVGTNPFSGKSHLNDRVDADMKDWYSEERIFATLRRCEEVGINTVQSRGNLPMMGIIDRYRRNGGKMHYFCQTGKNAQTFEEEVDLMMQYRPSALCIHGELADDCYLTGCMDRLKEMLDSLRRRGLPTGLCAHFPEVLTYAQEHGWAPDYYMASVYNISQPDRSRDVCPTGERFEDDDVPVMYRTVRSLDAPAVVLKILGAGRKCADEETVRAAFLEAYRSVKPGDGVLVGMFDKYCDQPGINASYAREAMETV